MVRNRYQAQLDSLNKELLLMGNLSENALDFIVQSLHGENATLAEEIMVLSKRVEDKERELENLCIQLLLKQQPVAGDLRKISASLKIVTDLKRIGEQAGNISSILAFQKFSNEHDIELLLEMAKATRSLVNESMEALSKNNEELAKDARLHDDKVDELFAETKRSLIQSIRKGEDNGEEAINCLMVAKYFEKISDHAVNIAGWVIFSLTGVHEE